MTTFTERQWVARRMLLCFGDIMHATAAPNRRRFDTDGFTSSDILCEECGAGMRLVDVLTIDEHPTVASLAYADDPPLYTTAKFHPLALIAAMEASS